MARSSIEVPLARDLRDSISRRLRSATPHRKRIERARVLLGIPKKLWIVAFLLVQSFLNILIPHLSWQGEVIWLGVLSILVLVFYREIEVELDQSISTSQLGQDGAAKLSERRGLVILMGLASDDPSLSVAKLLTAARDVEYIALLGTPQTEDRKVADGIRKLIKAAGHSLEASHIRTWEDDNNAMSIADFERSTREAISWMVRQGLSPEEIVVDTTQGKRFMGLGAFVAAELMGVETQVYAYEWDHLQNEPIPTSPMFKTVRSLYSDEAVREAH